MIDQNKHFAYLLAVAGSIPSAADQKQEESTTNPWKGKGFQMSRHRVKRNEFRLGNDTTVTIESWTDSTTVHVAAYDTDGHQISLAQYQASVDSADFFSPQTQAALIDSLANALEYDLMNHPEIHVRKR